MVETETGKEPVINSKVNSREQSKSLEKKPSYKRFTLADGFNAPPIKIEKKKGPPRPLTEYEKEKLDRYVNIWKKDHCDKCAKSKNKNLALVHNPELMSLSKYINKPDPIEIYYKKYLKKYDNISEDEIPPQNSLDSDI